MGGSARTGWEISLGDEAYPRSLLELERPPEELRGLGDPGALSGPCLAVVGARRATPDGLAVAEMAARVAARHGITVVSGGAMGCDRAAGLAAVAAGGRSVIVSGCGADVVYPTSSQDVFEATLSSGGAVLSLERWGAGPRRWAFPKRNSVIAALSQVLVVTEAGLRSGTMSTAETAVELGRAGSDRPARLPLKARRACRSTRRGRPDAAADADGPRGERNRGAAPRRQILAHASLPDGAEWCLATFRVS